MLMSAISDDLVTQEATSSVVDLVHIIYNAIYCVNIIIFVMYLNPDR